MSETTLGGQGDLPGWGGGCLGVTVRLGCSFDLCVSVTVDVIAE